MVAVLTWESPDNMRLSVMQKILHILRTEPDEAVEKIIEALAGDQGATVVCLYQDGISDTPVNWHRLVDDIFSHDKVICW